LMLRIGLLFPKTTTIAVKSVVSSDQVKYDQPG
jgi:hypothetical protein